MVIITSLSEQCCSLHWVVYPQVSLKPCQDLQLKKKKKSCFVTLTKQSCSHSFSFPLEGMNSFNLSFLHQCTSLFITVLKAYFLSASAQVWRCLPIPLHIPDVINTNFLFVYSINYSQAGTSGGWVSAEGWLSQPRMHLAIFLWLPQLQRTRREERWKPALARHWRMAHDLQRRGSTPAKTSWSHR